MQRPKNFGEAKERGLEGYETMLGHVLVLKHGLMGTFPALIRESCEVFVCTDLEVLKQVWELLPKRQAKLLEFELHANLTEKIGFRADLGDEAQPIIILDEEGFRALSLKPDTFMWSPGLLSLDGEGEVLSPFA